MEALFRTRSLWGSPDDVNVTMETDTMLDSNITQSLDLQLNATEEWEEPWMANATFEQTGRNQTEAWTEITFRIVGGQLERRGGSPWQV